MEKIPGKKNNESNGDEKKIPGVEFGEDGEYVTIRIGEKTRYIPKREKILVGNESVDAVELAKAMAFFPDDGPENALKKLRNREKK